MPAIVTNKFRIHNSEQFSESFSESGANVYYMLLGRPQPFATSTRGDSRTDNEGSDSSPLTPADAIETEFLLLMTQSRLRKSLVQIFLL